METGRPFGFSTGRGWTRGPRLTPENAQFISQSGKWTASDVSAASEYSGVSGAMLTSVDAIGETVMTGAIFHFDTGAAVTVLCEFDETHVTVRAPDR